MKNDKSKIAASSNPTMGNQTKRPALPMAIFQNYGKNTGEGLATSGGDKYPTDMHGLKK
jgi:hypothetical protein